MYGELVDINAFLQRPLLARVATNGPTLRPLFYLYEEPAFYWLTDTSNFLYRAVTAGERLVLVIDECDIDTGEVVHVRARGFGEIIAVDRDRAMRKFSRYLGLGQSTWDPRFVLSLDLPLDAHVPLLAVVDRSHRRVVRRTAGHRTPSLIAG